MRAAIDALRADVDEKHERLREDVEDKHRQNRGSIHELRNSQQAAALQLQKLAGKIEPYLDNGQPGLFTKMNNKLDEVLEKMTDMRLAQASDSGSRGTMHFWLQLLLGPLVVGILLVIAQHYWK